MPRQSSKQAALEEKEAIQDWLGHPVTKRWLAAVRSKADHIGNAILDGYTTTEEKEFMIQRAFRAGLLDAIDIKEKDENGG
jgi:hypothetical protein